MLMKLYGLHVLPAPGPGSSLSKAKLKLLLQSTGEVMQRALAQGGTSFDALYVNTEGESGYFARSLEVYGREGNPVRVAAGYCAKRLLVGVHMYAAPIVSAINRVKHGVIKISYSFTSF